MLAKGISSGKTLGLTAGLHGNEASGIPTIQKMFHSLATLVEDMKGCVVAIPCCNQFGFENSSRFYQDGADLNRCFTNAGAKSNEADAASQPRSVQFANNLFDKILVHCDILFDIHTASFGRENSFYIRADMKMKNIAKLARLLQPQIIVHSACTGDDEGAGTLREACTANGIDCLAIQIGECLSFDRELITRTYNGIGRVLHHLNFAYLPEYQELDETLPPTVICVHSYWIHTTHGGILVIGPKVADRVVKGQFLGSVTDIFGFVLKKFYCPDDGIVVGRSTNPSNVQGDLIVHLGIVADPSTHNDDGTVQIPENISNRLVHDSQIH